MPGQFEDVLDGIVQKPVAAAPVVQVVEQLVVLGKQLDVLCLDRQLHLPLVGIHQDQFLVTEPGGGKEGGKSLQVGPDDVHLPYLVQVDVRHRGPLVPLQRHQPQRLQVLEGLPHRGAADVVLFRQGHLGQPLPGF